MIHFPFPISIFLWAHILGGLVALITFSIPLFSKKGGRVHVRVGWIYAYSMILVAIGAFSLTIWRYFLDPHATPETQRSALFLFFIGFFTVSALQQGILVFRYKKRDRAALKISTIGFPCILLAVSVAILGVGITAKEILLVVFPIIASRIALKQIAYWKSPPSHPQSWWFFHLENMFTCCIGTVTAFLVVAVPRLFPSDFSNSPLLWMVPTIVMVPWMAWFIRKYQKKFGGYPRPTSDHLAQ